MVPAGGEKGQAVTVELERADAEAAFRRVAEAAGVDVEYRDGVVTFIGSGKPESVVMPIGYSEPSQLEGALVTAAGGDAKVVRVGDRLVMRAKPDGIARAIAVARALHQGPDGWHVDARVVEVSDRLRTELGLGVSVGGTSTISAGWTGPVVKVGQIDLMGTLRAAEASGEARLVTSGRLHVLEGSRAELQQGDSVPVPQRTVSDQGTVTVTGYTFVQSGVTLSLGVRRVPAGVLLDANVELSTVTGFIEGAPIIGRRHSVGSVVVESADWLLLSVLEAEATSIDRDGLGSRIGLGRRTDDRSSRSVLVLVRAARVFAGAAAKGAE